MGRSCSAAVTQAAALACMFVAGAAAGDWLSRETGNVAAFWPPDALLLGFLLRSRRTDQTLPIGACALANVAFNLVHGDLLVAAVGFACANMLEVACAYGLVAHMVGLPLRLAGLRELLAVLLAAVLAAPTVGATLGAALVSHYFEAPFWTVWHTWWTAGAVGMILFVPLIVSCDSENQLRALLTGSRRKLVAAELAIVVCLLVGGLALTIGTDRHAFTVVFTPILLWIALRFGIGPTAAAAAAVCLTAVVAAVHGVWPLPIRAGATVAARIAPLQLFVVATVAPSLLVAVVVAERQRMAGELSDAKRWLDDALESMADGLALFDADQRLVFCNANYRDFCPALTDLLQPGIRFEEMVRAAVQRGCVAGVSVEDAETFASRLAAQQRQPAARYEVQLADGRLVQTTARRTCEGGIVGVQRDVTELRRAQRALEHAASHDALTELANRAAFTRALEQAWARAQRGRHRFAVMLIDLDRFKAVNDKLGHAVGDMLLIEVAARLRAALREGDLAARLGGDEFAILAKGSDAAEFAALAARLVERLATPVRFDGIEVRPGASLGLTVFPDDGAKPSELMIHADRALYAAKHAGRGTWAAYGPDMLGIRSGSAPHHDEMVAALERGEFELHYQPIVALDRFELLGVEALLRWRHPERGLLPAGAFIGAAERRPLIIELTRHVLARALRQQRAWAQAKVADLRLWINIAPRCLAWEGLVDTVAAELAANDVPAQRLVIEITEGAFANLEAAEAQVKRLKLLGLGVAIDDFGAGYSSLGRLRSLPMDTVKIDRAFVAEVARAARDQAIVRTIVALGENLGLTPLAEGIETSEQLRTLRKLGCVWGQGYLFARPMPPDELPTWLDAWNERRRLGLGHDRLPRRQQAG